MYWGVRSAASNANRRCRWQEAVGGEGFRQCAALPPLDHGATLGCVITWHISCTCTEAYTLPSIAAAVDLCSPCLCHHVALYRCIWLQHQLSGSVQHQWDHCSCVWTGAPQGVILTDTYLLTRQRGCRLFAKSVRPSAAAGCRHHVLAITPAVSSHLCVITPVSLHAGCSSGHPQTCVNTCVRFSGCLVCADLALNWHLQALYSCFNGGAPSSTSTKRCLTYRTMTVPPITCPAAFNYFNFALYGYQGIGSSGVGTGECSTALPASCTLKQPLP